MNRSHSAVHKKCRRSNTQNECLVDMSIGKTAGYFLGVCFKRKSEILETVTKKEINLLKSAGHVMHQQFNIQQLYVLPTLCLCVLYLSENKQRLVPLTA